MGFGFVYQWWAALAFCVSSIPVVGTPVGNHMTWALANRMGAPLCQTPQDRERTSAFMNYPYWYFTLYYIGERLGVIPSFEVRNNISDSACNKCPTLFVYATSLFHS